MWIFPSVNFVPLPSVSWDAGVYLCCLVVTARYTEFPAGGNKQRSACTFTPGNNLKSSIDSKSELSHFGSRLYPKASSPALKMRGNFLKKNMKRTKTFPSVAALKMSLTLLTQTGTAWDSPLYLSRHSKNLSLPQCAWAHLQVSSAAH